MRFSTGVLRAFPSTRMPEETRDFLRQADCVVEETREEVLRHVLEGQADLGFLIGEEEDERLFRVPVERVPVVACLRPDSPLAGRERISLEDLRGVPVLTMNGHDQIYHDLLRACRARGFEPQIRAKAMEGATLYALIRRGGGTAVVPAFSDLPADLVIVPLQGEYSWTIWGICRQESRARELLQRLALQR